MNNIGHQTNDEGLYAHEIVNTKMDKKTLQHAIEQLARTAGQMILDADIGSGGHVKAVTKSSRRGLVTATDLKIQQMLMQELNKLAAPCRFLCEEDMNLEGVYQIKDRDEVDKGVCFIIDPIDGTANFVHGHHHSCTSIAMTVDGEAMIGVIYDPYRDELFSACKGKGTYLNGQLLPVFDAGIADVITVFGTAPYDDAVNEPTFRLAHQLYEMSADVRRTGSAALDLCWTACGRFGLYAELGLSAWDFAAGKLIAEETGCIVTDIHGNPLTYKDKPSILCGRPTAVKEFKEKYSL